jgi:predicted AlkP superfamily phosphohydrolase/phosphomutase
MRRLGQLMRINLRLSVKQVAKTSPKLNKCDLWVWDALAWEVVEKNLHNIPLTYQSIPAYHIMHVEGFVSPGKQDPTSETYGCSEYLINVGLNVRNAIKKMVKALDINILHIENIRNRIERLEETCKDIVDDMRLANHDQKTNI